MKRDRQAVNQRHADMLSLIRQRQEVLVTELCQIFDISPMTARRDLQVLEERGKLRRFHGGAAIDRHAEIPLDPMDVSSCKRWIARYAASLVEDGDCLLMNGSTTALAMLDYLDGKRVTVYTNNGLVVGRSYPENVQIRLFGGTLRADHILTGDLTLRNLMDIRADKAFLGCIGISPGGEILCGIPSELGVNETMIAHADRYYVLADHTKIGRSSPYASFLLEKKGSVITDIYAASEVTDRLRDGDMEVVRVSDARFADHAKPCPEEAETEDRA